MSTELYDLLFEGVMEGKDHQEVKAAFTQLFGVDLEKVERIFSADKAVLKTGVDATTADKYIARLASIGVIVSKRSLDSIAEPELSLSPMTESVQESAPGEESETGKTDSTIDRNFADAPSGMHQTVPPIYGEDIRRIPFEFKGEGFEYFKIWIVNILLSIITLGIYSAWAKVRNKQYFYGNTSLDNITFEYTAEPLKILKGRLIAVLFFIAYSFFGQTSPSIAAVMALLLFVLMPWIVVNSLKFNARHSSYRNINFRFVGTIGAAAKNFILWPMLGVFTLGILFPFVWKKQMHYITSNHLYGTTPFKFDVHVKEYYKMLFIIIAGGLLVGGAMMLIFGSAFTGLAGGAANIGKAGIGLIPVVTVYIAFYLVVIAYFVVTMANIHFNNTQLQEHKFASNWTTGSYTLLLFTNTLGILLTLGLFIPFAKVRTAAYKAAHTALVVRGGLESFIAAEQEQTNSIGEGIHDIFDIDISL